MISEAGRKDKFYYINEINLRNNIYERNLAIIKENKKTHNKIVEELKEKINNEFKNYFHIPEWIWVDLEYAIKFVDDLICFNKESITKFDREIDFVRENYEHNCIDFYVLPNYYGDENIYNIRYPKFEIDLPFWMKSEKYKSNNFEESPLFDWNNQDIIKFSFDVMKIL